MMEGASSTSAPAATTTASAAAAGASSRCSSRGGRHSHRVGRGSSSSYQRGGDGSGGNRGVRGRGRGHFRGARGGRGGGGHGYVPKKAMRHRSLSGKHGTYPGLNGEPSPKREKKEKDQKPNSNFALLHSILGDAAMIAEYIRRYHSSEKFRDARSVNTFLQAISQRPEQVYAELMANHKDEVFTTLERLFAVYALGKQTMTAAAHEFFIRCEHEGVRKVAWGEGVKTLPDKEPELEQTNPECNNTDDVAVAATVVASSFSASLPPPPRPSAPLLPAEATSLLSPRELLKKLAALDPMGRLQRLIELSSTVEDVQVCAKKLAALISDAKRTNSTNNTGENFDFASKCQLISKLLSKARRVVEPTFAPPSKAAAEAKGSEGGAKAGDEGKETTTNESEVTESREDETPEKSSSPADGDAAPKAHSTAAPAPRRCCPLTEEEIKTFQSALSVALRTLEDVLKNRPPNVTQQPLSKFSKLLEWCKARGLLATEDERFITVLEQQVENDIAEQATQLETVISLKSLPAGDTAALTQLVDKLWSAGDEKCFAPSSVDVLSAIAVAAGADGIAADTKRIIADRLVQTQRHLPDTVVLPRRALRFVNGECNKVKQAAIAKQLEHDAANYKVLHGGEEEGERDEDEEEEDVALEVEKKME